MVLVCQSMHIFMVCIFLIYTRDADVVVNSVPHINLCRFYLRAANVAPKNGKPYNQLAIIALCAVGDSFLLSFSALTHE